MIADRFSQFGALVLLFLWLGVDTALAAVIVLIPLGLVIGVPVVIGFLLWNSAFQLTASEGPRTLARLRWALSHSYAAFSGRKLQRIGKALIKAYDLAPGAALPEQAERFAALMRDARDLDRRLPAIFQHPLGPEKIGEVLAEASGLAGEGRSALIAALHRAEPRSRERSPVRRARIALRRALAPLVSSRLQRRRIAQVYTGSITRSLIQNDERLGFLVSAINRRREQAGYTFFEGTLRDPIAELPLGYQRELVLLSEIAFGIADFGRMALTDPSRIKWARRMKALLDRARVPPRSLWEVPPADTARAPSSQPAPKPKPRAQPDLSDEERREKLEAAALPAILLRRTWPIGAEAPGRSWFGGTPLLPKSMPWPRLARTAQPLHFLAQIDCADLPRVRGSEAMPEDGLTLFFANIDEEMLWDDDTDSTAVVYVPAPAVPDTPAQPPQSLPEIGHADGQPSGGYARAGVRTYPMWPLMAAPVTSYPSAWDVLREHSDLASEMQANAIAALLPTPSGAARSAVMLSETMVDPETGAPVKGDNSQVKQRSFIAPELVAAGFPFCGAVMSRFAIAVEGDLVNQLTSARATKTAWERQGKTELVGKQSAEIRRLARKLAEFGQVSGRLTRAPDHAVVTEQEAAWFIEWLETNSFGRTPHGMQTLSNVLLSVATQAATDARTRALLPQALFDFLDKTLRPSPDQSQHMMLGHAQFKTNETGSSGIRLLALDSDWGCGFMFCDCGMAEVWIDEEDLRQRDFGKVRAYTAGG